MIEIHSIYGLCVPADMELADIEHASIPEELLFSGNIQALPVSQLETDTPGINKTNCVPAGNADNSPSGKS